MRWREDSDDSEDAYDEAQLLVAKARSLSADQRGSQQQGQVMALSVPSEAGPSEAGPSQFNMGAQDACREVEVAQESCSICLVGCEGEPQGRPDGQAMLQGWGFTSCCRSSFHFSCLSRWLLNIDEVDSTSGLAALPTYCPQCRSTRLTQTSTRMRQSKR
jgi:hypothetical protein